MSYARPHTHYVPLRGQPRLEAAMKKRDVNGSELAALAGTHRQTISNLRRGERGAVRQDVAEAIETALRVERGYLFRYSTDDAVAAS